MILKTDPEWQEIFEKISLEVSNCFGQQMSDWQIDAMVHFIGSPMNADLTRFEALTKPDLKVKGDKRNGAMSRQQAFGKLFRK